MREAGGGGEEGKRMEWRERRFKKGVKGKER